MHIVKTNSPKTLSLGLQGAGTYGAFTWGVLDRLLDEDVLIDSIGGSSSGAVNAVVLADGYALGGGRQGAQAALKKFWTTLGQMATFSPLQRTWLDRAAGRWTMEHSPFYHMLEMAGVVMGPARQTLLSQNPLRNFLSSTVDFGRVRACREIELFVAATNIRTGTGKLFTRDELDPQRVLASACLPTVFAAAEVDGEFYWDGSYVANPPLAPLVKRAARDLLVVQNNPIARAQLPRSLADTSNRANEIAFNISFVREISALTHVGGVPEEQRGAEMPLDPVRLHMVSGTAEIGKYSMSSKFNAELVFLQHLHDLGTKAADDWLRQNWSQVGLRSTFDGQTVFFPDVALKSGT